MAKFVKVGYGHDGRGLGGTTDGYTYVVNDNVNKGNIIQPIATQWKSGTKFVTTGQVLHAYRENSPMGKKAKQEVENRNEAEQLLPPEIQSQRSKEIQSVITGGGDLKIGGMRNTAEYRTAVRGANVASKMQQDPNAKFSEKSLETFEEYSRQFMPKTAWQRRDK